MKKLLLFVLILSASLPGFSQKEEVKKEGWI